MTEIFSIANHLIDRSNRLVTNLKLNKLLILCLRYKPCG